MKIEEIMSGRELIHVLIVDDHAIVREGLKKLFEVFDDLELLGEAENGRAAVAFCQEKIPDVILMDISLPGMDGIEATRKIHDLLPQVKIIMLTSYPEDDLVPKALQAGAIGYVLKNISISALADAIRSANDGRPTLDPKATQALINAQIAQPKLGGDLSQREREVLALVVQGLSNKEIAERLVISPATARNHVSACLNKLGASNRAQATYLATKHELIASPFNQ
ncbi:MAG: response regulator transcription factor [Candidatus Promineifilaceae bacterium]|nr:response regulator transcription factor [Candidatus Promineifilaceae bacterium]